MGIGSYYKTLAFLLVSLSAVATQKMQTIDDSASPLVLLPTNTTPAAVAGGAGLRHSGPQHHHVVIDYDGPHPQQPLYDYCDREDVPALHAHAREVQAPGAFWQQAVGFFFLS